LRPTVVLDPHRRFSAKSAFFSVPPCFTHCIARLGLRLVPFPAFFLPSSFPFPRPPFPLNPWIQDCVPPPPLEKGCSPGFERFFLFLLFWLVVFFFFTARKPIYLGYLCPFLRSGALSLPPRQTHHSFSPSIFLTPPPSRWL